MTTTRRALHRCATWTRASFVCGVIACAAACGGGGGGDESAAPPPAQAPSAPGPAGSSSWAPGVYLPAAAFAAQCAAPRPGTSDVPGSVLAENNWLRAWSNELYLWYDEIQDRDPGLYTTPAYFDLLKTFALDDNGRPKDRFHFTVPTEEWLALSQSGVVAGYGVQWVIVRNDPPRSVVAAYTQPGSPAALAGIERGAEVLAVDGVDVVSSLTAAEVDVLNQGLFPAAPGETHDLLVRDGPDAALRTVVLTSAAVTTVPVQDVSVVDTPTGPVGYLHFTDHLAVSERLLIAAIEELRDRGVTDLVLDIRYNGGGLLPIASELAYMIAGPARTAGRVFEISRFNDKHTATNPVTGLPLAPTPFYSRALGFSALPGETLPTLDLDRVYVLTGATTCSASESIINGLRGVDFEVIQIGSGTCGKPYGFYPRDNCGTTYFSIQVQAVNEKGFGDYPDGFSAQNTLGVPGVLLPGCAVADDFGKPLGDPTEARFAAALAHREGKGCPVPTAAGFPGVSKTLDTASDVDGIAPKSPWLENRILAEP